MGFKSKISLSWNILCITCMAVLVGPSVFAQHIDTAKLSIKPKAKVVSKVPQIKANISNYKPSAINYNPSASTTSVNNSKPVKMLTVLKVYPNPVSDQININLRLEKEALLSVTITDLLGNTVVTLANEKSAAGELTKTYTVPNKLNAGMYFLKIVAGGALKVWKISVL